MNAIRVFAAGGTAAAAVALAGCLSSAPPAPAVRYFDPTPDVPASSAAPAPAAVRVTAAPHLGRPFAVRVGPRELAFDPVHSWFAEPKDVVETALWRAARAPSEAAGARLEVHVDAFEVDVQSAPRARVRLEVRREGGAAAVVAAEADAVSREPEALAAAMAAALARAVADAHAACRP